MLNNYLNRPRNKAWLGAAIGAAVGLGSTIFGAITSKNAQAKQYALQRNMEARNAGITGAGNLTQAYANSDELDKEFRNRFLRYGGRRKAEAGTEEKTDDNSSSDSNNSSDNSGSSSGGGFSFDYEWSNQDTNDIISGVGSAVGDIASSLIRNNVRRNGETFTPIKVNGRKVGSNDAVYDSAARSQFLNNYYKTATMRMGGKRGKRC